MLACIRIAAVSSRRVTSAASAAFFASVTLFISSFISPGRITSRIPAETIVIPNSDIRVRAASSSSRATASRLVSSASSSRAPTISRSASCAVRYSACVASSTDVTDFSGSLMRKVTSAFMRSVTLSAVMIS